MHAEATLLEATRRLRLAMEASRVSTWDTDLRTRRVYMSEGWAELLGEEKKETTTTVDALMAIAHPDDLRRVVAATMSVMKGESAQYVEEHRVRTRGGDWRWVRSAGRVIEHDRDGRALHMAGTNVDIHENIEGVLQVIQDALKQGPSKKREEHSGSPP